MDQDRLTFRKTRLAPTPSGYLHIGNVFSFALTAALAKKTGAGILLRIDDLDRERAAGAYIQDIFDTLHFMGLQWDEGPKDVQDFDRHFSQLHRMALYKEALGQLENKGLVFACDCSRTKVLADSPDGSYKGTCLHRNIPLDAKEVSWRLDTSAEKEIVLKTFQKDAVRMQLPPDMQYFVVRKKDGFPAYQLSSLMDDLHFGVDLVVRGQDLLHSTIAQLYLADVLGKQTFLQTTFYHHPLLQTKEQKKLSKSAGDTSVNYLRKHGKTTEDVYALIGAGLKASAGIGGLEEFIRNIWDK
jgi:glutamyl-tRNA synthetase